MSSENKSQILHLATNDHAVIEVGKSYVIIGSKLLMSPDRQVAERSIVVKHMLEDIGDEAVGKEPIPLPNVCPFYHLFWSILGFDR